MELPEEENTPEKRVDRIFAMMDKVNSVYLLSPTALFLPLLVEIVVYLKINMENVLHSLIIFSHCLKIQSQDFLRLSILSYRINTMAYFCYDRQESCPLSGTRSTEGAPHERRKIEALEALRKL